MYKIEVLSILTKLREKIAESMEKEKNNAV